MQLTKQGFAFVFDRVTGKPVWPIEERPVPQSDVAGEHAWPTQPFPTKPAAFAPQGMTLDDAFDLTPELKAAAQAELKKYRLGPLYTPPSVEGTFTRPGVIGGANWGGAAFDPATGMLYVKTSNSPAVLRIVPADIADNPRASEIDADFVGAQGNATFRRRRRPRRRARAAVDAMAAAVAAARPAADKAALRRSGRDQPEYRRHRVARAVRRHAVGAQSPGAQGRRSCLTRWGPPCGGVIVTKSGLVIGGTGDDSALHALDASTGREMWQSRLPRRRQATPMTYRTSVRTPVHRHRDGEWARTPVDRAEMRISGMIISGMIIPEKIIPDILLFGRNVALPTVCLNAGYRDAIDIVFHVVNRAARRAELFAKPNDYEAFLRVVEEGRERTGIPLLAYCVMPNHFHLLVRPTQLGQMSRFMRWFQLTHAKRWHRHRESRGTGAVYQGRYRAIPIETDLHFLVAARYVERNPVRAGLVRRAEEWRWSSLISVAEMRWSALGAWPILPPAQLVRDW